MVEMTDAIVELLGELSDRGSPIVGQLRPGLSRREVTRRLAGAYPVTAADDVVEWFSVADGLWVPENALGGQAQLFAGYVPMTLEEALAARQRELAFAGRLLLESVTKGHEPFITTALDSLPILAGQPVVSLLTGDPQTGEGAGRVCAARWGEQFAQIEPNLVTWVRATIDGLRSEGLIVAPFGQIYDSRYATPDSGRQYMMSFQFSAGGMHCLNSSSSVPLPEALARFAENVERCGSVAVVGYPEGWVVGNEGAEPEQILEVVRLLKEFGVPADHITTLVEEPDVRYHAHTVSARVTIPLSPRPRA